MSENIFNGNNFNQNSSYCVVCPLVSEVSSDISQSGGGNG